MVIFALAWSVPWNCLAGKDSGDAEERARLIARAKEYFDAEMTGDYKRVWEMLAPSSLFKNTYSYAEYVEIAQASGIRVSTYDVEEVMDISDNSDPKRLPHVEKIGLIRVHVNLTDDKGKNSEHWSIFTFLKEGGTWYKG